MAAFNDSGKAHWAPWTGFDEAVAGIADSAGGGLRDVKAAMEVVKGLLDTASAAASIIEGALADDPLVGLQAILVSAYSEFLANFRASDLYVYPHLPKTLRDVLHEHTTQDIIDDLLVSLRDRKDPDRPDLGPAGAYASFTLMVGADNWMDFRRLLKLLGELFSAEQGNKWAKFADIRLNFDKIQRNPVPRPDRNSQGVPWDWTRTDWMDLVPGLTRALDTLESFLDSLVGIESGLAGALQDLVEVLVERIAYVQSIIDELAKLADFLANLAKLLPHASVLGVTSPDGGSAGFARAFTNSGNKPPFKLCAGITILAIGANPIAQFDLAKKLFGIKMQGVENARVQLENVGNE